MQVRASPAFPLLQNYFIFHFYSFNTISVCLFVTIRKIKDHSTARNEVQMIFFIHFLLSDFEQPFAFALRINNITVGSNILYFIWAV